MGQVTQNETGIDVGLNIVPSIYLHINLAFDVPFVVCNIKKIKKSGENSIITFRDGANQEQKVKVLESKDAIEKAIKLSHEYHDAAVEKLKTMFKDVV